MSGKERERERERERSRRVSSYVIVHLYIGMVMYLPSAFLHV